MPPTWDETSPPKFGNPLLPWNRLPGWLRALRVLFFVLWGSLAASLATLFVLQFEVLKSPTISDGGHTHLANFKGAVFYLSEPLFSVWSALSLAIMPLVLAGLLLGIIIQSSEYRIKRRLWDAKMRVS